ncbi:MAG: aminotransferase class III-fold pyridoxal phosphate-dependent enzyme, partial [Myxococcales bacterium]|nr:aminotransferase class III-fold pyridoxal phosphate-dependent enzyme [Myxococcales bacterium]
INVASEKWLKALSELCKQHGIVLIVDDIQMGCGRTGAFFSFEAAGIRPDIVCLSKSISGYGLPFALTLLRPELDVWAPGEHNGTFRGHNLAFVTGRAALDEFWTTDALMAQVAAKSTLVQAGFRRLAERFGGQVRGRGFVQGIAFDTPGLARAAARAAFERGLLIETAGAGDRVLKFLAPLTIDEAQLREGLDVLESAVAAAAHRSSPRRENRSDVCGTAQAPIEAHP